MIRVPHLLAALPVFLLSSCSDSSAAGSAPTVDWPASGSKIFADTPILIGGAEAGSTMAVMVNGEALAADNAAAMVVAGTAESLNLPVGEVQVSFQLLDEAGNPMSEDSACEASFTVVEVPAERRVFFKSPADGAKVKSPFKVEFGLVGMGLTAASVPATIPDKTVGHHHIMIGSGFLSPGEAVPENETNIHFGKAQTETELNLAPGKYSLTLQFADGLHLSYGETMAATIQIEVIE
ncbi:MAG: DUF4399 domain-containing protein [Planctomycetota bacterium]|jgi:hypothetical protein